MRFRLDLVALALVALGPLVPQDAAESEAWRRITSNDGAYVVRYRTTPRAIELGVDFDVEAEVLGPDGTPLEGPLHLRIDGDMPEHGHGLLHPPRTERLGDRRFRARELRCFMPGYWELYFDVTRGAVTERAQAEVEID